MKNVSPTLLKPQLNPEVINNVCLNQIAPERRSDKAKSQEASLASTLSLPSILRIGALKLENLSVNYDPLKIGWYFNFLRNSLLYDSLVQYDLITDRITPALAKNWVVSNDSKHWTFYLREDIVFHDGSKFNASSVKFMYDRIIDPGNPAYVQDLGMDIAEFREVLTSVTINDEFEVTINFNESYAPFINFECLLIQIVSPNSFNEQGDLEVPIGTGPYILNLGTSNETFQNFTSFTRHFEGVPPFAHIYYYFQENFNLSSQSIDFFPIAIRGVEYGDFFRFKEVSGEKKLYLGFLNHRRPEFSNRLVRMAINYAINRSEYIKSVNETTLMPDSLSPMYNLIPPGMLYANDSIPGFPYDLEIANDLLDRAGYYRETDGYRFSIDLVSHSQNSHLIKPFLEAVGIQTNVIINDSIDYSWFWDGEYDISLIGLAFLTLDPHNIGGKLLHSLSHVNTGGFENSTVDNLVMLGAHRPVKQEREYYYNRLQLLIQDAVPYLYLNYATGMYAVTTHVEPYVFLDKLGNIEFNYTAHNNTQPSPLKYAVQRFNSKMDPLANYENIIVFDYPIYFPFTDAIVAPTSERQLSVSMKMSHYLESFIPDSKLTGKFYQITVDNKDIKYSLRCYYDLDEIKNISIEHLALFQWNEDTETWIALKTVSSNPYLRYVEAETKGDVLIRFGEEFISITYRFAPLFALSILGLSSLTIFTIFVNIQFLRKIKEESQL
ncbi:MAG: ABC transporter substrate-binding protein [Candidatus Hodarchaeota archaeon]